MEKKKERHDYFPFDFDLMRQDAKIINEAEKEKKHREC